MLIFYHPCLFPSLSCYIYSAHSTAAVKSLLLNDKPICLSCLSHSSTLTALLPSLSCELSCLTCSLQCRAAVNLCCSPLSHSYSLSCHLPLSVQCTAFSSRCPVLYHLLPLQHLLLVVICQANSACCPASLAHCLCCPPSCHFCFMYMPFFFPALFPASPAFFSSISLLASVMC